MHNGCPPKTENTPAATAEESKTSATPYIPVVSMRSKEKAIPGRTLKEVTRVWSLGRRKTVLGKENERSRWDDSIIPGINPVTGVIRNPRANVIPNTSPNPQGLDGL